MISDQARAQKTSQSVMHVICKEMKSRASSICLTPHGALQCVPRCDGCSSAQDLQKGEEICENTAHPFREWSPRAFWLRVNTSLRSVTRTRTTRGSHTGRSIWELHWRNWTELWGEVGLALYWICLWHKLKVVSDNIWLHYNSLKYMKLAKCSK